MPYANPNNPKRKAYEKKYRILNKKKIIENSKKWRIENKDKFLAQRRRWSHRPNGIAVNVRGRAKRRGVLFEFKNNNDFVEWYKRQKEECYYCGMLKHQQGGRYKNLSIDRLDNLLPYRAGNIVLCCFRCNIIKGNFFTANEMLQIAEKYIKPKIG